MIPMNDTLKQSAAPDTGSDHSAFSRAVLRLTAYYALGAFVIVAVFTALVYFLFIQQLPVADVHEVTAADQLMDVRDVPTAHELRENLMSVLLTADLALLALSIVLGYVLSRATLAPIERAYLRQKRFIAEAAHELRTPLAVLTAGASFLGGSTRSVAEYREFVGVVKDESGRLSALANDLLFLARRDEGAVPRRDAVDLSALVGEQCAFMQLYAKPAGVELIGQVAAGLTVTGDADHLARLVVNLVKNAIDYNRTGGSVQVALAAAGTDAVLTVRDTGIGIPAEAQQAVFERFYKVDPSRGGMSKGAGLGLAIVKEIVAEHGGTVTLESTEGEGTRVTVRVPVAQRSSPVIDQ